MLVAFTESRFWCDAVKQRFIKSPLSPLSIDVSGRTMRRSALKANVFLYISGLRAKRVVPRKLYAFVSCLRDECVFYFLFTFERNFKYVNT